jgi:hypothetical protein
MAAKCYFEKLTREGNTVTITSISCLAKMQKELQQRSEGQEFDEAFKKEIQTRFKFTPPPELKGAKSLILLQCRGHLKRQFSIEKQEAHVYCASDLHGVRREANTGGTAGC